MRAIIHNDDTSDVWSSKKIAHDLLDALFLVQRRQNHYRGTHGFAANLIRVGRFGAQQSPGQSQDAWPGQDAEGRDRSDNHPLRHACGWPPTQKGVYS